MEFLKKLFQKSDSREEETFLEILFALMGQIAVADGTISEDEVISMERFIHDALRLPVKKEARALKAFHRGLDSEEDFFSAAERMFQSLGQNRACIEMVLDILLQVSIADGVYSEEEAKLIEELGARHGFQKEDVERLKFHYIDSGSDSELGVYFSLLGCSEKSSLSEVESSFETLRKNYKEETLQSYGLPEEFLVYATRRYERIEQAYKVLKSELG